jgi:transcriptional regulator with PAS, ATPase and Fis domain
VGELPLTTQVRLLRVQNGEFIKVGSSQVQKPMYELSATNVNLFDAIEKENSEKICITV